MGSPFEFPVVPCLSLSAVFFATGYIGFRSQSPIIAFFEWLGAFVVLGVCVLVLFMEQKAWPGVALVLVAAICESVLLAYCVTRPPRKQPKRPDRT